MARDSYDWPLEKILNKNLQTVVEADKLQYRLARLEKDTWKENTFVWKGKMPQRIRIRDENDLPASSRDRPNILARHLQNKQWVKTALPIDARIAYEDNPLSEAPEINCEDYTIGEFEAAVEHSKPNKTPGPDQIPIEHLTILDEDNRSLLLEAINLFANSEILPPSLQLANVVLMHKKVKLDVPANYRPISPVDSILKVYSIMLRCRIQEAAEHSLHNEQYGFRPKRSTSQPLFSIQRLADIAGEGQTPSVLASRDWEKAFDRLSRQALFHILQRMRFPLQIINQIKAICKGPLFRVFDPNGPSDTHSQNQGIRQGCTISPYLLNLVMHTLIHDTNRLAGPSGTSRLSQVIDTSFISYADDAVVIGDPNSVTILIHSLQRQAALLALTLMRRDVNFLPSLATPVSHTEAASSSREHTRPKTSVASSPISLTEQRISPIASLSLSRLKPSTSAAISGTTRNSTNSGTAMFTKPKSQAVSSAEWAP